MAQPTKEDRLAGIHAEALREFDTIQSAVRDERLQCLKDRRFYSIPGAQWEGPLGSQFENKPKFEVNKIHLSVIRIFNEYRNNRISVSFIPKEGREYDKLADACTGLYRASEQDSAAEEAYDNAFEEATGGGMGAWRLRTEYEDDEDPEDEKQRIIIEPIYDADSCVFFDLNAKRQDKSDAKTCYVLTSYTPAAYKAEFGDDPTSWNKAVHQCEFDWATPDVVFVAEYYRVEEKTEVVQIWLGLDGEETRYKPDQIKADPDFEQKRAAVGDTLVRSKRVKTRKVHKYLLSGSRVLEDCGYIAGKNIPIIVTYGKRWYVDNVERCMGHVRLALDTQRLKNMQLSKLGEISALSAVEKPILTPEQIAGHQVMWSEDNVKNYPYLLVNPITDANGQQVASGPVAYTRAPNIPPAMAALLQITDQDIKDLLGNQEVAEQMPTNISGVAVELINNRLDMQTFIYVSNLAKAMKRSGEVWLSMAQDVFVEQGRKMKTVGPQGEVGSIELYRPTMNDKTGEYEEENDLSKAKMEVTVEVGPSSASKRAATVRSLSGMASVTDDPETKQVLGAMAMLNMEGEGISDAREYFRRKLLKLGVVKPTEEEAQAMAQEAAGTPPDANTQYLTAAADEALANATAARAKTVLTVAQAEKAQADTIKTLGEVDAQAVAENNELLQRFPDWNEAMQNSPAQITGEMEAAMRQMPDPHLIAYALAKNPQLADQIAQLPEGQQGPTIAAMARNMEAANARQ